MKIRIFSWVRLLRFHHWIKNIFVLIPLVFSPHSLSKESLLSSFFAFLFFGLAASLVYIVNDLKDIESDRKHPKKSKKRPLASGEISIPWAIFSILLLLFLLVLGLFFSPNSLLAIVLYLTLNVVYTFWGKNQPVLDISSIALGFVLRVLSGALAIGFFPSPWLFLSVFSLTLYLAALKRKSELSYSGVSARASLSKYSLPVIESFCEISKISTLIFYSFFASEMGLLMILSIPLVLLGLFRYTYRTSHTKSGESPTASLLKDPILIFIILAWGGWSFLSASGIWNEHFLNVLLESFYVVR